jgi:hypothetical protein
MEIWKDIKGYEGIYQISNEGRVKRLAGSPKCKKDRILKNSTASNGYLFVSLCNKGQHKLYRVHRLVLETFSPIENMENLQVNHLDEDRTNNKLNNLQWCTCQENINYGNRANRNIGDLLIELAQRGILIIDLYPTHGVSLDTTNRQNLFTNLFGSYSMNKLINIGNETNEFPKDNNIKVTQELWNAGINNSMGNDLKINIQNALGLNKLHFFI